jgi:hypothetical protein
MKLLLHSFVIAPLICGLSFGQATVIQTGTVETGFVVITPASGSGDGLSVSAIFGHSINGNLFQTSVMPSPLITFTSVVVSADPTATLDTGIAIANPTASPAVVTLDLHNPQGVTVSRRTITIGGHQQISQFATELFAGDPVFSQPVTGLLFIGSNVPIGVMALALNGTSFTALPVAAQLVSNTFEAQSGSTPVAAQSGTNNVIAVSTGSPAPAAGTFTTTAAVNSSTFVPATTVAVPLTPTFNGVNLPPTILPTPTTTLPTAPTSTTTGFTAIAGVASPFVLSTGLLTAGVVAGPGTATFSTGVQSVTPVAAVQGVTPVALTVFPLLTGGVGGSGALLLPQVATGGGWGTQITIANTSAVTQTVRADFFNPQGGPLAVPSGSTVSNIVIAPGGMAVLTQ